MMSKRRRASSVASRGADGDDSDDVSEVSNPGPPPSTHKRKKMYPADLWLCQQLLYDSIRSYKKEDGTYLCDSFIKAPTRRREPQYYEVVSQPIDLLRVQLKMDIDAYEDMEDLTADIELLVNNAKAFYKPDSVEYKDAIELWRIYSQNKQALENGEKIKTPKQSRNGSSSRRSDVAEDILSETSTNTEEDIFEELFNAVMTANLDGRPLYKAFQFLPSKRRYPVYYSVTDQPIDLKTIAQKIQGGEYSTLGDLEKDMLLMVRNACHFNEPGSQIYKDAKMLKKVIQVRKRELDDHCRCGRPRKTSERIRSKRNSRVGPVPTSRTLAIMEPPGSDDERVKHSEESGGESDEEKLENEDSPQWKLFETIKNQLGPNGRPRVNPLPASSSSPVSSPAVKSNLPLKKKLHYIARQLVEFTCSDGRPPMLAFMEKPSKKVYPEYYNVIDRPIDMITIEANIKNDRYNSIEEMVSDFRLMFSNCRQFNEEGSMIYEDANLLERVMTEKLKELNSGGSERKTPLKTFKAAKSRQLTQLEQKLRTLYDAIRDYRVLTHKDPKANRQLALIFMKLPLKTEYPDYYELIKNPIDMEKIAQKLKNGVYQSVNELASDFMLMLDNACKYNGPDSQIYKDALILQRVCLQTKQMLKTSTSKMPKMKRNEYAAAQRNAKEGRENDTRNLAGPSSSGNVVTKSLEPNPINQIPSKKSSKCPESYNLHYAEKHVKQHGVKLNIEIDEPYDSDDSYDSDYEPTSSDISESSESSLDSDISEAEQIYLNQINRHFGLRLINSDNDNDLSPKTLNTTDQNVHKDSDSSQISESSDDDHRLINSDNDLSTGANIYESPNTTEPKLSKKRKFSKMGQDSDNSCFYSDNDVRHIFDKYAKKISNCLSNIQKRFKSTIRVAYKCKTCSLHFLEKSEWRKHLVTGIHTVNSSKCDHCMLNFSTKSMRQHLKMHEKNGKIEKKLKFSIITDTNYSLSENITDTSSESSGSDNEEKMSDETSKPGCSKTAIEKPATEKSNENTENNIKKISNDQVHSKRRIVFRCETCYLHFLKKSEWRKHLLTGIHTVNSSLCLTCKLNFSNKSILKHLKTHEKNEKRCQIISSTNYSSSENIIDTSNESSESDDEEKMSDGTSKPGSSKTAIEKPQRPINSS